MIIIIIINNTALHMPENYLRYTLPPNKDLDVVNCIKSYLLFSYSRTNSEP